MYGEIIIMLDINRKHLHMKHKHTHTHTERSYFKCEWVCVSTLYLWANRSIVTFKQLVENDKWLTSVLNISTRNTLESWKKDAVNWSTSQIRFANSAYMGVGAYWSMLFFPDPWIEGIVSFPWVLWFVLRNTDFISFNYDCWKMFIVERHTCLWEGSWEFKGKAGQKELLLLGVGQCC